MKKVLAMLAVPLLLGAPTVQAALTGALGVNENTCVSPIAKFVGASCSFSGGANIPEDTAAYYAGGWIGPLGAGGFYASVADAPGFILSSQTGNEYCLDGSAAPCPGAALTTFPIQNAADTAGTKLAPTVDGAGITVTGSGATASIGGTFAIGAGVRQTGTGGALQGSKQIVETWSSIVHTSNAHGVDTANDLGGGAWEYIIGSDGFPTCTGDAIACPFGEDVVLWSANGPFGDPDGADSGQPASASPWAIANGGSGPQTTLFDSSGVGVDIVSYGLKTAGSRANVGLSTSAVFNGTSCSDTGLDPVEADTMGQPVIDNVSDCFDSSVAWSVGDNAAFDNMILKITTDSGGAITNIVGYYTLEYIIIGEAPNSWVGGTISMSTAVIPVPAAVWLFGSALGLLGWIRRRVSA